MAGTLNPLAAFRNPEVGMVAVIRKRRGIISEVRDFDGSEGRVHLVRVEYKDDWRPDSEELLWELEPNKLLQEPNAIPKFTDPPMPTDDFDALVRAARWTSIAPYLDPDEKGPLERMPISAPFHGSIEVENYQLIPLLKALRMPRVNLMIADDVGLGKTIEAGLILSELVIRRRINRILILTPASLRIQWRDELWSKFSLPFEVIDRDSTMQLRRSVGVDANPWRCFSRAIASYHYLRQPDVLEQFMAACQTPEGSAQLPWDLLVVDEVHNLMPSPFGGDSQLCDMLRHIAPQFEHRLFLTATPHNGHTRAFTGLLELLDPVRFSRVDELQPAQKERIRQVVIRRLKREINQRTDPPRFCTRRPPQAVLLEFTAEEQALITAFNQFRDAVRSVIASSSKKHRLAGWFAIEILGKRMLSGPMTFLESWRRCKMGLTETGAAEDDDVIAAGNHTKDETADDREAEQRNATAAGVIGAWLQPISDKLEKEIAGLDLAAKRLGVRLDREVVCQTPKADARYGSVTTLIDRLLRDNGKWRADERLVIFTEYKTTLDYLLTRSRQDFPKDEGRFLTLYGGMHDVERESIKDAFNDPENSVRVLIATDAASEGLNLQSTARYLLHYDCPWNPARLEQRNGRLDRHGQARDVHVMHFASDQAADIKFIAYLIHKIDRIRDELGATGDLFDEATYRCIVLGEDPARIQQQIEASVTSIGEGASIEADDTVDIDPAAGESALGVRLRALRSELDLDLESGRTTLEAAMSVGVGRPQLSEPDKHECFTFVNPNLSGWKDTIDESVRRRLSTGLMGPVPKLTFSTRPFMVTVGNREVFRPRTDTLMLHLAHPLMQRATGCLSRFRFPGADSNVSRWTVRLSDLPGGSEALVLLHLEELAVNELRETFHHWIRTLAFPIHKGKLGQPLAHVPAERWRGAIPCRDPRLHQKAEDLLLDVEPDLQDFVKKHRRDLTERLTQQLAADREQALKDEDRRYQSRQGEVSTLIAENTLAKLERQIEVFKRMRQQGQLWEERDYLEDLERRIEMKEQELERRKLHYEDVREQLARERERIVKHLIPRRYALQGTGQVFPVTVELRFRLTEGASR